MDQLKKAGRYQRVSVQLEALLQKPGNTLSQMATIAAVLSHKFGYFFWCGFYLVENSETLTVGPYQGPVACQVLSETGVCLAAVKNRKTMIVPDVHRFPGHIACDSRSSSEIVVPVFDANGNIYAVLDVDSTELNAFDETDAANLEKIVSLIVKNEK